MDQVDSYINERLPFHTSNPAAPVSYNVIYHSDGSMKGSHSSLGMEYTPYNADNINGGSTYRSKDYLDGTNTNHSKSHSKHSVSPSKHTASRKSSMGNESARYSANPYSRDHREYRDHREQRDQRDARSSMSRRSQQGCNTSSRASECSSRSYKSSQPSQELSIMERYLQSQQELEKCQKLQNPFEGSLTKIYPPTHDRDVYPPTILEPEPVVFEEKTPPLQRAVCEQTSRSSRGSADGKSADMDEMIEPKHLNIQKLQLQQAVVDQEALSQDVPRVLLRGGTSPSKRGLRKVNRKSLDSLIMRTLDNIEEAHILNSAAEGQPLEHQFSKETVAMIKEMIGRRGARSYDSISSTCSSSVGELKRAYEFGKKYGLQEYPIPAYLVDTTGDREELDEEALSEVYAHLENLQISNFSGLPRDSNDIKVQIPLPVRLSGTGMLERSGSESDLDALRDDAQFLEQSLV